MIKTVEFPAFLMLMVFHYLLHSKLMKECRNPEFHLDCLLLCLLKRSIPMKS